MLVARLATDRRSPPGLRAYLVAPGIALVTLAATLLLGARYGLGLRDPDGVVGVRLLGVLGLVLAFWALDIVPRGVRRARRRGGQVWQRVREVAEERWGWRRAVVVLGTIVAFYVTYLCYRNLKSYVPLARPELHDAELMEIERTLFGTDPALLLHDLLGTGGVAHVLSTIYVLFLTFVPVSIGIALVWSSDLRKGLWWVAALSLNWVLGAASYYVIPALGPVFVWPGMFAELPETAVASLQDFLREDRRAFLADPVGSGGLQSVAAFASLHVSIVLTGAIIAHLLRAPRALRIALWAFVVLTSTSTIYFGWHYLVDDLGGIVIALVAVSLGARLTGWRIQPRRSAVAHPAGAQLR